MIDHADPDSPRENTHTEPASLRDFLRIFFRHKIKIVSWFTLIVLLTLVGTFLGEPSYQSEAKLLIRIGRESVSLDPAVVGPTMTVSADREYEINSEISILTSPLLVGQVVDQVRSAGRAGDASVDPTSMPWERKRDDEIREFMNALTVSAERNSNIIALGFSAPTPEEAQYSLETLIERFLSRHIEVHSAQASPAFFQQRSSELLAELMAAEEVLEEFRFNNQIASIEVQKEMLLSQVTGLQARLNESEGEIDSSQARMDALERALGSLSETSVLHQVTGIANPTADEIKRRLIELRFEEVDLVARYPDDERALVDVRQQIALAMEELAKEQETRSETTRGIDENFRELQLELMKERSDLFATMARRRSLTNELGVRTSELERLSSQETVLARLEREVDIAEQEYREYVARHQRADISAALDSSNISNVSVVQPANLPTEPNTGRALLNLVMGLFIGVFGGIGLAYFAEHFDDSLKTPKDVADYLQLPVLASFSVEESRLCT